MTGNHFGTLFQYTSWGESHGPAIGCVIDGVPPRIPLCEADIQPFLDKRRPGQSRHTTQRQELDQVKILSGVFEGMTTGTPISLVIENQDQKSKDYGEIKDKFRPGHADFTYQAKYGIRDYRGGGRSSARETAMRVAAGAVARKILVHLASSPHLTSPRGEGYEGVGQAKIVPYPQLGGGGAPTIRAGVVQIGVLKLNPQHRDWDQVSKNPFFSPWEGIVAQWTEYLDDIRKNGNSVGAVVEVQVSGIPAGLGAPVYDKLDADLAKALMSINAAKGVEIGNGFEAAAITGVENADEMRAGADGQPEFLSNNAGGILGGISSGQDIIARVAFKPTSSILTPRRTIDRDGNEIDISTKGRHDPCVGIRGVPVVEAMVACVLADHWLLHKAQCL